MDCEESELGATCIAAPIFGAEDTVTGALSVSGPSPRIQDKQHKIIQSLKSISTAISRSLSTEYAVVHRR
jgi:DNA-binding IclR family transcriptional regulator